MNSQSNDLNFTRACSRSDIIIGVIAATVLWVILVGIGLNVAETAESRLIVTGSLIASYLVLVVLYATSASTVISTIIIRPDHTIEFRYANPRFDQRIAVLDIISVYRPPSWEIFYMVPLRQCLYQPGQTYFIHRNGYIALGKIHHFTNFRNLLRVLIATNPAIVIIGISI